MVFMPGTKNQIISCDELSAQKYETFLSVVTNGEITFFVTSDMTRSAVLTVQKQWCFLNYATTINIYLSRKCIRKLWQKPDYLLNYFPQFPPSVIL